MVDCDDAAAPSICGYSLHRTDRQGYKAGALEAGRRQIDAEFIVIFDSDFVPPADFLLRAVPHFYQPDGSPEADLALVQAQWGHLNHDQWAQCVLRRAANTSAIAAESVAAPTRAGRAGVR